MIFDSADFPLENEIIVAKEDEVYYETEKNNLTKTWDKLLEYYNDKLREECKEEMKEEELYNFLMLARKEIEVGKMVYDLIGREVLKTHPGRSKTLEKCEFKPFILRMSINLLSKGIGILKESISHETTVWEKLKDSGCPVRLMSGEVRVYVTKTDYILLDDDCKYIYPPWWKPKGLMCEVKYCDLCLRCFVPPKETMSEIEAVREYFLERYVVQTFVRNEMEISVYDAEKSESDVEKSEKNHSLCECVIEELKSGCDIYDVCKRVTLYLSRILTNKIVESSKRYTFLRYAGPVLEDGLTKIFFVLTNDRVVKIVREEPGKFDIFVDEIPLESFSLV